MSCSLKPLALLLPLLCQLAVAQAQTTPKVAVVVAGDPEAELRELAHRLSAAMDASPELRLPSDRGLTAAMRGEPAPAEDDGLGRVRSLRRRLGWEPTRDAAPLHRLGRGAGVQALVVLRSATQGVTLEVFDVGAGRFYEDALPLDLDEPEANLPFIISRARAALRRARGQIASTPIAEQTHAAQRDSATPPSAATAEDPPPAEHGVRSWFKHNWAYIVGGVLLVGVALGYGLSARRGGSSSQPTLRFRPGGD
ncbi:MAG: hypothetical protein GXP55_13380 [Deltaproteobacteria bacterium]|nr:hypothetical protein [Deltaproteobacteria bacterium]